MRQHRRMRWSSLENGSCILRRRRDWFGSTEPQIIAQRIICLLKTVSLSLLLMAVVVVSSPAIAGDKYDQQDRQEKLERQQRLQEERQQRLEERRQRAEERQRLQEERKRREAERQQERQRREAERQQAALERAQAKEEREAQKKGLSSGVSSTLGRVREEQVGSGSLGSGKADLNSAAGGMGRATNSSGNDVSSSKSNPSSNDGTTTKDNPAKYDTAKDKTAKDNAAKDDGTDTKTSDKAKSDDDDDDGDASSVDVPVEDMPEPATLVELFNKVTGSKPAQGKSPSGPDKGYGQVKGQGKSGNDDVARDGAASRSPNAAPTVGARPPGGIEAPTQALAQSPAKAVTTAAAPPARARKSAPTPQQIKAARTTPDGSPKRGAVDFELLEAGSFRQHEIVASGLGAKATERARELGFTTTARVFAPGDHAPVQRLVVPKGMSEASAVALLAALEPGALAGPNHVYRILPAADKNERSVPVSKSANTQKQEHSKSKEASANDEPKACVGDKCFARQLMHWKSNLTSCAQRARVGVIDTSFDTGHPAFSGRRLELQNFGGSTVQRAGDWHGTAVLSVLAGAGDSGTPGLVPDAEFLLASTFNTDRNGQASADAISVLRALAWLDGRGVNVVNMSFSGPPNAQIEATISAMAAKGVIFVAAAGNLGVNGPPSYPAAYKQVIAVTAISKDMRNYRHASRGDYVDVAAPGVNIWTALPNAREGYRTGTSFAAPFVTGLLAAMPAARKNIRTKADVLSRVSMQDLGTPGRDPIYGEGLPIAPERCNEVGGVASLPWTDEAKRMGVGGPAASALQDYAPAAQPDTPSAASSAFGFAQ